MKVEFVNPFVTAAAEVVGSEVGVPVQRGPMSLARGLYVSGDVTVLVSLIGRVEGSVLIGMSYQTAKTIVGQILGQPFEHFDELAQSGVAELANVITGLASTRLGDAGYASIISVPMLIIGKGASLSTLSIERLVVTLCTPVGDLTLALALRENPRAPAVLERYTAEVAALTV